MQLKMEKDWSYCNYSFQTEERDVGALYAEPTLRVLSVTQRSCPILEVQYMRSGLIRILEYYIRGEQVE